MDINELKANIIVSSAKKIIKLPSMKKENIHDIYRKTIIEVMSMDINNYVEVNGSEEADIISTINDICFMCGTNFNMALRDTRKADVVFCRQAIAYYLRVVYNLSLEKTGSLVFKNHGTIISSIKAYVNYMENLTLRKTQVITLENAFKGKYNPESTHDLMPKNTITYERYVKMISKIREINA